MVSKSCFDITGQLGMPGAASLDPLPLARLGILRILQVPSSGFHALAALPLRPVVKGGVKPGHWGGVNVWSAAALRLRGALWPSFAPALIYSRGSCGRRASPAFS